MKSGFYYTLKFKSLFVGIIVSCLTVSLLLYIAIPEKSSTTSSENIESMYNKKQLIIVDPGHGGEDGGTVSSKGVNEKKINLEISEKLKLILRLCGYRTEMTREEDKLIYDGTPKTIREKKVSDLRNRLKFAETNNNSIFLSIHQNYFSESKYWGAQVFYSVNNPDSKALAENIQNSVVEKIQNDNTRKVKQSGKEIYLLHNIKSPAVMVECGFMSNPSEALMLEDNSYQIKMALSIIDGINNYLSIKGEM